MCNMRNDKSLSRKIEKDKDFLIAVLRAFEFHRSLQLNKDFVEVSEIKERYNRMNDDDITLQSVHYRVDGESTLAELFNTYKEDNTGNSPKKVQFDSEYREDLRSQQDLAKAIYDELESKYDDYILSSTSTDSDKIHKLEDKIHQLEEENEEFKEELENLKEYVKILGER